MGDSRRRRLTLPPNGLPSVPDSSSPECNSGSRYACLREEVGAVDNEDCLSETPFETAMDVIGEDEEADQLAGWTPVT